MKRILITVTAVGLLAAAIPASAQAACNTGCLRGKVNTLTREVRSLTTTVNGLTTTLNGLAPTVTTLSSSVTTVGNNVSTYHAQQVTDEGTLGGLSSRFSTLQDCLGEYPVTEYGDPSGSLGYLFNDGSGTPFDTTALDVTASGDAVGAWTLFDTCNSTSTANIARAHIARATDALAPSFLLHPVAK